MTETQLAEENKDKICKMYLEGKSVISISKELDIHTYTIYKLFEKIGFNAAKKGINKLTELEKEELIQKYINGMYVKELAKEYGISKTSVANFIKSKGIEIKRFIRKSQFSEKDILEMKKMYDEGASATKIAKQYNVDATEIYFLFDKKGFKCRDNSHSKRTYELDENYFDVIDTPNKAYFLGLLYADGYNGEDKHHISLTLQEEDKHILESFQKELKTNKPLKYENRKEKNPNCKNCWGLHICNKHMSESLSKLGCIQAKSLILKFPTEEQVPKQFIRDFIRGYFDGDGSIPKQKKSYSVSFVGTKQFCEEVLKIMEELGVKKARVEDIKRANENTKTYRVSNWEGCKIFLDFIYKDSDLYLYRKYERYQKLIKKEK